MSVSETIAGRFVIADTEDDLLGRGGMGAVYRGRDSLTGDTVAIKALNPELVTTNPETVTRFRREAEALRKLNHPNIVQMIAALEENGRHYLIVEFVDGGNLRQFLDKERQLPIRQVLRIALELADALSRTHHLRIIHRDLKPANVLLTAVGTPKLTDFGVASMADSGYLTQTGMWVGTPQYLSPEACNGEKLDERADIWAFGILLYEMLAGKVPFAGDTLMATLTAIFRHPLSDLMSIRPDLPEALNNLIQHMLVKERDQRIGSMRLVAAELEAIIQGKPSPGQLGPVNKQERIDLVQLPQLEFEAIVGDALKRYREGDWLALADSPLAHSTLVEPYFLPGEPVTGDSRAQALQVMLRWGIEKLNPGGPNDWLSSSWRHYNILYNFYIEGHRVSDLAERMAIAEQTFYSGWRPQAINAMAKILHEEIIAARELEERHRFSVIDRYQRQASGEQKLLRLLTIFNPEEFVPTEWVYSLAPNIDVTSCLHNLLEAHLVQRDELLTAVRLNPIVYPHLTDLLSPEERSKWHSAAAQLYLDVQTYLEAARHFRQANEYHQAATVLIQHRPSIFDKLQVEGLRTLLTQFRFNELADNPNIWAQLKIVAGKVAEYLEDIETAIAEYGEALSATNVQTKAEAYYLRAKVLQRYNLDESLAHFAYCVDLVERNLLAHYETPNVILMKLLTHIYIDRSWIYIQERPDWHKAELDLDRTEQILRTIGPEDRSTWSDLYNARAELAHHMQKPEAAIVYRQQAWLAASETKNVDLMTKTAYNLGCDYLWSKRYQPGLDYLQKSSSLAKKAGNAQMRGLSIKGIGDCYSFQGMYQEAISHYREAYNILLATKNLNWRGGICYDLSEAFAETGNWPSAKVFFEEGKNIAKELGQERLLHAFADLAQRHPALISDLLDRQEQALLHTREKGNITMQEYMGLAEISRSQAHRDLSEMVEKGILQRVGKGRGTRYLLAGDKPILS
ncbi:MAG: protein kinase [Ardenticatenaceae bacterium]|nr:protein kinase [Anaerolineales bacterium]MCB8922385.1 protein kinase [Ardenticatenaceae bacterium]MCB8991317.1 protein kinase [Ardenticatenaceae bacterium]